MPYDTIDTQHIITLFHRLMRSDGQQRVLFLEGEGDMGKSHLLTKVFPELAVAQYNARHMILDLRNQLQTIVAILQSACSMLGDDTCANFDKEYQAWRTRPKVSLERLTLIASTIQVGVEDTVNDIDQWMPRLTHQFVKDIEQLSKQQFVFFIDSVDGASDKTKEWLTDTLLVPLVRLPHVRVVVAGRSLPSPHGSYMALYHKQHMHPIKDLEAYASYCEKIDLRLEEQAINQQAIQVLALLSNYCPGSFVANVYKIKQFFPSIII